MFLIVLCVFLLIEIFVGWLACNLLYRWTKASIYLPLRIIQRVEFGPVLRWREVMKEHYAKTGQLQWWRQGGEWPCSSMGVDEMNKIWWNETKCSQILESLFHWQFWAHIGSWAMLWRRAMIRVRNTSAPEKITGCVAYPERDAKHGFKAPPAALDRIIYPMLQDLPNPVRCIIGSSVFFSEPGRFPSRFSGHLPEAALVVWHWCGKSHHQNAIKVFHTMGVSQKGSFKGHDYFCFWDTPSTTQISNSRMAKRDDGSKGNLKWHMGDMFRALLLLEGDTQNEGHEMDRLHCLKTVISAQFWLVTSSQRVQHP